MQTSRCKTNHFLRNGPCPTSNLRWMAPPICYFCLARDRGAEIGTRAISAESRKTRGSRGNSHPMVLAKKGGSHPITVRRLFASDLCIRDTPCTHAYTLPRQSQSHSKGEYDAQLKTEPIQYTRRAHARASKTPQGNTATRLGQPLGVPTKYELNLSGGQNAKASDLERPRTRADDPSALVKGRSVSIDDKRFRAAVLTRPR